MSEPLLDVFVTGFGPFPMCPHNPSARVATELAGALQRGACGCANLRRCDICDVSAAAAHRYAQQAARELGAPHRRALVLHIGVDQCSKVVMLETTACNKAEFRLPDVDGRCAVGAVVGDCGDKQLHTALPVVERLVPQLSSAFPGCVAASHDAGAFCSLWEHRHQPAVDVLFAHVPPFDAVPCDTQVAMLLELIRIVASSATA